MNGDTVKALRAIKAKTLIMTGTKDLLNPEWEPQDAARFIRDVRVTTISPGTVTGHASAGGAFPADVDFLNREISQFLDLVTQNGKKMTSRHGSPNANGVAPIRRHREHGSGPTLPQTAASRPHSPEKRFTSPFWRSRPVAAPL